MGALVLPEQIDDAGSDLAAYFDRHRRWFFGLFLLTLMVSVAKDIVFNKELPGVANLGFHALFAAGCVAGILARRWRTQEFLGVAFAVAVLSYIGLLFGRLR